MHDFRSLVADLARRFTFDRTRASCMILKITQPRDGSLSAVN